MVRHKGLSQSKILISFMNVKLMAAKKKNQTATLSGDNGWAAIFDKQGESLAKAFDQQRVEAVQREQDVIMAAELFHKLWGDAHDSPIYNKDSWIKMQNLLRKLGVLV